MFFNFLDELRAAGIPASMKEHLVLLEALDRDVIDRAPEQFYFLSRAVYVKAVRALITPRTEVFFAGKVDPATLSFFERLVVKMVKSPIGDRRDWGRIRAWADDLGARLQ